MCCRLAQAQLPDWHDAVRHQAEALMTMCLLSGHSIKLCISSSTVRAFHSADIGITTNTTSNISSTCLVLALVAGRQDCQPRPNSPNRRHDCCLGSFSVNDSTLHDCKYSLRDALQCIAQSNTSLLDCMLCNTPMIRHFTKLCRLVYPRESAFDPIYQGNKASLLGSAVM